METAIATQEQLANKIEFVVELLEWEKSPGRNWSRSQLHFRGSLTTLGEGLGISSSDLKLDLVNTDTSAFPIAPGALFRVTLERIK